MARIVDPARAWMYVEAMGVDVALNQADHMAHLVAGRLSADDPGVEFRQSRIAGEIGPVSCGLLLTPWPVVDRRPHLDAMLLERLLEDATPRLGLAAIDGELAGAVEQRDRRERPLAGDRGVLDPPAAVDAVQGENPAGGGTERALDDDRVR